MAYNPMDFGYSFKGIMKMSHDLLLKYLLDTTMRN